MYAHIWRHFGASVRLVGMDPQAGVMAMATSVFTGSDDPGFSWQ